MTTKLPIVDVLTFSEEDGTVEGWACALIDAGLLDVSERRECAAPRGECARGMTRAFQCLTDP
jgi:hypothetical protein